MEMIDPVGIEMPRPAMKLRGERVLRLAATGARHGAPVLLRGLRRTPSDYPAGARALRRTFEGLGATYVKLGQFVASAPGLVGEDVAEEFRGCLDTGPPVPFSRVRAIVESDLGGTLEARFSRFGRKPIAAASISVVHRATLRDGREVAVKVLRPGIERTVAADLANMAWATRTLASAGFDSAVTAFGLAVGLRAQIAEELDLRNEARTMVAFRELFEGFGLSLLAVPAPLFEHSSRRVLTMEYLDGVPIDDLTRVSQTEVDPAPLVRELIRAWMLTGLRERRFHADIHAGNLLLLRDGRLGMIDWGIVARLDDQTHRLMRRLIEASLGYHGVWTEIASSYNEVQGPALRALGLTDEQIVNLVRETLEPLLTRPLAEVSMATLLMSSDETIMRATGAPPPRATLANRWRAQRRNARSFRESLANGSLESSMMRMSFLATKQLVYLERYGRMYVPDESILGDKEFLRRILADLPATDAAGGLDGAMTAETSA
jgi:predicted unusual protein kinase regulating ubiquinone biosynthesis (AarF/ABC1/UbiB family)